MPNKRADNKRLFGVSLDKDLVKAIDDQCAKEGITRVEFFRRAAEAKLNSKEKRK